MLIRTRALPLLAAMSIGIAACGSSAVTPSPSPTSSPPPSSATTPAPTAEPTASAAPTTSQQVTVYRVKQGDTLYGIARHFKLKLAELIAANPQLKDPNVLKIGARINIPVAAKPSPSA